MLEGLTRQRSWRDLAVGLLAIMAVTAAPPAESAPGDVLLQDHPLVGSLWHTGSGRQVDEQALIAAALQANWILLGEGHHNPEHHRLQARIVDAIGAAGRQPGLVWEMAGPDQAEALAAARLEEVDDLGDALDWEERGWFTWAIYQPIAAAALSHDMAMYPGNPSWEMTRAVGRGETLPQEAQSRLNWALEYDSEQLAALTELLDLSHCGALPKEMLGPMTDVQRLRDASMAASLREADRGEGAILIAGSEHVREDRGVPWRLGEEVFSLAVMEVAEGRDAVADYPRFDPSLFDYVWFTEKVEQEDHCAKFTRRSKG